MSISPVVFEDESDKQKDLSNTTEAVLDCDSEDFKA